MRGGGRERDVTTRSTIGWDAPPGPSGLAAELTFRNHFANKRNGHRIPLALDLVVRGRAGRFPARTVNVSRSGALLEITDDGYAPRGGDLATFARKVEMHFRTGMDVHFVEQGMATRARVVRVTCECDELRFACRFSRTLSDAECERLGLDGVPEGDADL